MHRYATRLLCTAATVVVLAIAAGMIAPRKRVSAAPKQTTASRAAEAHPAAAWKLAVVLRRDGISTEYVGIVSDPAVPPAASPASSGGSAYAEPAPAAAADYEIWLAADGATRGLWFSSRRCVWGELRAAREREPEHADDGSLQQLVRSARPATPEPVKRTGRIGRTGGLRPLGPLTLEHLCEAPVIAIGRVVGIVRQAHTPVNSRGMMQHTVYAFAVERYLKADKRGRPRVLKVWQSGGNLPWEEDAGGRIARGIGYREEGETMLAVGDRYCLFFRSRELPEQFRNLGYIPAHSSGVRGKAAELDEYLTMAATTSKILLRDGITHRAAAAFHGVMPGGGFVEGPQLLGIPEPEAIRRIEEALEALERQRVLHEAWTLERDRMRPLRGPRR
jgi:hypothetical protein